MMSSVRVNPYVLNDLLADLNNTQQQADTASLQMSTGSRINKPSDDPAGAAQMVTNNAQTGQVDTFLRSIGSVNGLLQAADSTLNSVVTALQRAISLGTEGANGTLSDTDRADVANELSGIQQQLLALANTSYQGEFIFAGTATVQPFVSDSTNSSGVTYKGNSGTNSVQVGDNYSLQVNLPGSQVFNGTGGNVFQSMSDLINALNTNNNIGAAVTELNNAYNYVTGQRVFYGNALNQLQAQQTYLNSETVNLASTANSISAADMGQATTTFSQAEIALNAELAGISRISQVSLFDYLK